MKVHASRGRATKKEFVAISTDVEPERPGYFALDAELNRAGASMRVAELAPTPTDSGRSGRGNEPRAQWCWTLVPPSSSARATSPAR